MTGTPTLVAPPGSIDDDADVLRSCKRRRWLAAAAGTTAALGLTAAAVPFVESLGPSAATLARGAPVSVDTSDLAPGALRVVEWRGRPVWLLRRSDEMLRALVAPNLALADPNSARSTQPLACVNAWRSLRPDLFVAVGLCTHLGCSPTLQLDEEAAAPRAGGFLCPCHGSRFDLAGRVLKNMPAPTNLEVPPHRLDSGTVVTIGA